MVGDEIKRLLLGEVHDRAALFSSQRELARRIAGHPGSHYADKERSLTVFLNQVLLGNKRIPDDLAELLVAVVAEELETRKENPAWARAVEGELRLLLARGGRAEDVIDTLLVRQLKAREVVIVNPDTLEGRGHPRSAEFQEAMFKTLLHGESAYTFVLDNRHQPNMVRHWKATYDALMSELSGHSGAVMADPEAVESRIRELEQSDRFTILAVEPSWCIVPLVAFDPFHRDRCDLYVWDWWLSDGKVVNEVAKLSPYVRWKWISDFYEEIQRDTQNTMRIKRVRYDDVRDQIK